MNENERFFWNDRIYGGNPWREPVLLGGLDEVQRDLMYMREMYPQPVRLAQDAVEDEMNRIDNSGSFIYDEYPDKYLLRSLVTHIMEIYMDNQEEQNMDENVLRDMITVLVLNEIYRRRRKRWW
jgi:hypothetical protein